MFKDRLEVAPGVFLKELEFHPAANIFPLQSLVGLIQLAEDIQAHGQHEDVVLLNGKILDGRNRYLACHRIGIEPSCAELDQCKDPVAYVLGRNLHRRHLTPGLRAMVAARAKEMYVAAAKERQIESGKNHGRGKVPENLPDPIDHGDARDAAGKAVGVSGRSVDFASKVLSDGCEQLVESVERGEVPVSRAAKIAKKPKAEQPQAMADDHTPSSKDICGQCGGTQWTRDEDGEFCTGCKEPRQPKKKSKSSKPPSTPTEPAVDNDPVQSDRLMREINHVVEMIEAALTPCTCNRADILRGVFDRFLGDQHHA